MARPSLTPLTFSEFEHPQEPTGRALRRNLFWLVRSGLRAVTRGISRALTTDLTSGGLRKTLPGRTVLVGVFMKLAWMPPAVVVACGWVVYRQTHGPATADAAVGQVARITNAFNERVRFDTSDGVTLSAIWVPAFKPQDVIAQGEELLKRREAAVVLVHDHGNDAGQMLSQASLLHEMGLHVLVLETRGSGKSERSARTYGRLERLDVAAAVDYLAARATVDSARIAVWAVGSSAEAAEHAPSIVPIALLIAERGSVDPATASVVDSRFMPSHQAYDGLRPVCRWLFEVVFAGGAPPATTAHPGRTVELDSTEINRALAELNAFASESLISHSN